MIERKNCPINRLLLSVAVLVIAAAALPASSQTLENAFDSPAGVTLSVYSYDFINEVELPAINWFGQRVTTSDTFDALEARNLPAGSFTRLDATMQGPAWVSFQWKVDTNSPFERLGLLGGRTPLNPIFGNQDWVERRIRVDCGEQTVSWYLEVSESSSSVSNAAWLDQLKVTPIPAVLELQSALDEASTSIFSDDWFEQSDGQAVNGSRAQSGPIEVGESSIMTFGWEGPVEISFDWGIDADLSAFDTRLEFDVSGSVRDTIYGSQTFTTKTYEFGPGSRCFSFSFFRDVSNDPEYSGPDEAFVDNLEITPINASPSLALAVDVAPNVYANGWTRQTQVTHDGVDAAVMSGIAVGAQENMYVELPDDAGLLTLWVKLSTQENGGFLDLWVDGEFQTGNELTGEIGWTKIEVNLDQGRNRYLLARYSRLLGGTGGLGDNAVYVDEISLKPGVTNYQPDLSIKAPGGGSWKGKNRYNKSGVNQLAKYKAKIRRPFGKFKMSCQNDCPTDPDTMKFYGTRSNKDFDIFYVVKTGDQVLNISAEFQTGNVSTPTLQALQSAPYEVWISRKPNSRKRSKTVRVRGVSEKDGGKVDAIKAKLIVDRSRRR